MIDLDLTAAPLSTWLPQGHSLCSTDRVALPGHDIAVGFIPCQDGSFACCVRLRHSALPPRLGVGTFFVGVPHLEGLLGSGGVCLFILIVQPVASTAILSSWRTEHITFV